MRQRLSFTCSSVQSRSLIDSLARSLTHFLAHAPSFLPSLPSLPSHPFLHSFAFLHSSISFMSIIHPLTHSPHSSIQSSNHQLTYSLSHSLTLTHSVTHLHTHPPRHVLTRPPMHSLTQSLTHSFTHSPIHPFSPSVIQSVWRIVIRLHSVLRSVPPKHSPIHLSSIHLFIHPSIHPSIQSRLAATHSLQDTFFPGQAKLDCIIVGYNVVVCRSTCAYASGALKLNVYNVKATII